MHAEKRVVSHGEGTYRFLAVCCKRVISASILCIFFRASRPLASSIRRRCARVKFAAPPITALAAALASPRGKVFPSTTVPPLRAWAKRARSCCRADIAPSCTLTRQVPTSNSDSRPPTSELRFRTPDSDSQFRIRSLTLSHRVSQTLNSDSEFQLQVLVLDLHVLLLWITSWSRSETK